MTMAVNLTGQTFGRWTALDRDPSRKPGVYWRCQCSCGGLSSVLAFTLTSGRSKSCGCRWAELAAWQFTTHGHTRGKVNSRTFNSWSKMRRRVLDQKSINYADYGGRGIAICSRWQEFAAFLEDMGECPSGKSLDRYPNNDGNYEPGNCRWATPKEQSNNRRKRRWRFSPTPRRTRAEVHP